jgi:hypothetical protein
MLRPIVKALENLKSPPFSNASKPWPIFAGTIVAAAWRDRVSTNC